MNFKNVVRDALLVFLVSLIASTIGAYVFRLLGENINLVFVPFALSALALLTIMVYVGVATSQRRFRHLLMVGCAVYLMKLPGVLLDFTGAMDAVMRERVVISSALVSLMLILLSYGLALAWLWIFRKKIVHEDVQS